MNKKIISISALVVVFALGFFYLNQEYLAAYTKSDGDCDKTQCDKTSGTKSSSENKECDKSSCGENKSMKKAGGEFSSYEFTTDKACCEEMKADLEKGLLGVAGVKEVRFSQTCNVSKMTNVTVMYSAGETNQENIASFVKEGKFDCSGSGCSKDGVKSGETKKDGCDGKTECPGKNKKSGETKQL
jgi:hypothetical protein